MRARPDGAVIAWRPMRGDDDGRGAQVTRWSSGHFWWWPDGGVRKGTPPTVGRLFVFAGLGPAGPSGCRAAPCGEFWRRGWRDGRVEPGHDGGARRCWVLDVGMVQVTRWVIAAVARAL